MKCFALLVLSAFSAFGQLTQQAMQPFFQGTPQSGIVDPSGCNCLAEWWQFTSTSLTTNANVTNWVGKIQGISLTNGAPTLQPTNSASGVGFSGANIRLTNAPIVMGSNWSVMHVIHMTTHSTGAFGCAPVWGQNTPSTFVVGTGNAASAVTYVVEREGISQVSIDRAAGWGDLTHYYDQITVRSNNANGGTGNYYGYTNGVFSVAASVGTGATLTSPTSFSNLGAQPTFDNTAFMRGFVVDVLVWTNVLTAAQVAAVHTYETNLYGYSP